MTTAGLPAVELAAQFADRAVGAGVNVARRNGIRYCYTGNVHDAEGGSTWCPGCGTRLIERDWYELGDWQLDDDGRCLKCGTAVPGVSHGPPGRWGRRRVGLRIAPQWRQGH